MDFALRIGNRATLLPSPGARAYGMVVALTHAELDRLYGAPGLELYRPEAVVAQLLDGGTVAALCYNLVQAAGPNEWNADYADRLQRVLGKLGFPRSMLRPSRSAAVADTQPQSVSSLTRRLEHIALQARRPDEGPVSGMQCSHGRHQRKCDAFPTKCFAPIGHRGRGPDSLHVAGSSGREVPQVG